MSYEMQPSMQQQHYAPSPYQNGAIKSETNSERGVSPHPSDYQSRYAQPAPPPLQAYQTMPAMSNGMRYPSPSAMQAPMSMMNQQYLPNPPPEHAYPPQVQPDQQAQQQVGGRPASDTGPPKAFACSTCGKGFARRSDLARHGRQNASIDPSSPSTR